MKRQAIRLVATVAVCAAVAGTAQATCGLSTGPRFGIVLPASQLTPARLAAAQSTPPARSGGQSSSIVGLWMVTFSSGGQVFDEGFDQWHSDGTEILNDNAPPAPPNGTGNMCLGVFKQIGPQTYKLRHPFWIIDADGNLAGSGFYLERVTVAPGGNTYSGTFDFQELDLNGNLTYEAQGTLSAQRITAD